MKSVKSNFITKEIVSSFDSTWVLCYCWFAAAKEDFLSTFLNCFFVVKINVWTLWSWQQVLFLFYCFPRVSCHFDVPWHQEDFIYMNIVPSPLLCVRGERTSVFLSLVFCLQKGYFRFGCSHNLSNYLWHFVFISISFFLVSVVK